MQKQVTNQHRMYCQTCYAYAVQWTEGILLEVCYKTPIRQGINSEQDTNGAIDGASLEIGFRP